MSSRRLAPLAAALVAAALVLSGCGQTGRPGVAAVVDGRVIPTRDVAQAAEELNRHYNGGAPETAVAYLAVVSPFLDTVAKQAGGVDLPTDYYATLDAIGPHSALTEQVLQASILLPAVKADPAASAAFNAALSKADIEMDPRYGVVDPKAGGLLPLPEPWIVATPTAG